MSENTPGRLGLGCGSRIKQGRDFSRIRSEGQRAVSGCLIANWQCLQPAAKSRVGVVVSSKVGSAVQRSRARRLLRETFRLHQRDLSRPVDLVLVARPSIAGRTYAVVERDLLTALRRAGLLRE